MPDLDPLSEADRTYLKMQRMEYVLTQAANLVDMVDDELIQNLFTYVQAAETDEDREKAWNKVVMVCRLGWQELFDYVDTECKSFEIDFRFSRLPLITSKTPKKIYNQVSEQYDLLMSMRRENTSANNRAIEAFAKRVREQSKIYAPGGEPQDA